MLHELRLAIDHLGEDQFAQSYKAMARVGRIQAVMTLSWDVLSTLTPVDYSAFRHVLGTSSGFQSAQFREVEYRLGIKDPRFLDHYAEGGEERMRLEAALAQPSLREASHAALERAGFDLRDRSEAAVARGLAASLSRRGSLVRSLSARRETGRSRRCDGFVASQACADGRTDHRQQDGHRRIGRSVLPPVDAGQARVPRAVVNADIAVTGAGR